MPIEASDAPPVPAEATIGAAYLAESRSMLQQSFRKIKHCLDQLRDEDLAWRPFEAHNSIQNLVLHLCGNLRQWIVHGVGGALDVRNRPEEFSDRRPIPKVELIGLLTEAVDDSAAVLDSFPPNRLLESRRIQGFDTTRLAAIFDCVSHFVGHTHQIVYITRLRLGDAYKFQWVPAGPEQGGPK